MTELPAASYTCPYCRLASEGAGSACPHCGAPTDARLRESRSGWVAQPPIRDLARIRFNRSTCQISGSYVPVAEFSLNGSDSVFFAHHALLHAGPEVALDVRQMPAGWRRVMAGQPVSFLTAGGPGHLAISADDPGETLAVPITPGHSVDVLEHRFLAATANVSYDWHPTGIWFSSQLKGGGKVMHHPVGQYLDRFSTADQPGLLLLHAHGNVFIRDLDEDQSIRVKPSSLVWKDRLVRMNLHTEHASGGRGVTMWLNLAGPGRIAVQSVFTNVWWSGHIADSSKRTWKTWE
jgi:uncharacterized protein (AIM24 family)